MRVRQTIAAVVAVLVAVVGPAPAYAQPACAPPGEQITPVPWSQLLLAPQRSWPLSTGAGQRVAVVSTGVGGNPILSGVVVEREDLAPQEPRAEPSGERDCLGIGTGVAGIVAAPAAPGVGFHGVAPDARILDAKVVGDGYPSGVEPAGTVAPETVAAGIGWAVEQDATVIVVPEVTYQDDEALRGAVADALAAGVVVIASAGEAGEAQSPPAEATAPSGQPDTGAPYPAAYDGVIGVGAIDLEGRPISQAGHVDLVAPGGDVLTTYPTGGLGMAGGAAFAAGYVAGSAALLRAYQPDLSPAEVARRLLASAAPAPEGVGSARYGFGIVNPYQALVERPIDGEPAPLRSFVPVEADPEELARRAAQERGDALASRLVLIGLAVAVAAAAAAGFGARGRRRRWRAGVAAPPDDRPEADHPEPPRELLDDAHPPR